VRLTVTSRAQFEPVRTGLALAMQLRTAYPKEWHFEDLMKMIADRRVLDAIDQKKPLADIEAMWAADLAVFRAKREKYLLYRVNDLCP
jgi:uncharacterized protein YbbC (DUF1343 family)